MTSSTAMSDPAASAAGSASPSGPVGALTGVVVPASGLAGRRRCSATSPSDLQRRRRAVHAPRPRPPAP